MRVWQLLLAAVLCLAPWAARAADTIEITNDHGGLLFAYQLEWAALSSVHPGAKVRIKGPCLSACTVLIGYIPRQNICVTPDASFGFHLATMQFATDQLWQIYPADIRSWINQHGGLTHQVLWLQPPAIYRFFHKC